MESLLDITQKTKKATNPTRCRYNKSTNDTKNLILNNIFRFYNFEIFNYISNGNKHPEVLAKMLSNLRIHQNLWNS